MKRATITLLLMVLISGSVSIAFGEEKGKELYVRKFCITCHGPNGISTAPNYPNLAKQDELYLINQVKDIIAKRRASKLTPLMTWHPVVMGITDEEISLIARYLSKLKLDSMAKR